MIAFVPKEAYRFAKGEEVRCLQRAARQAFSRPLDFLVVSDHSDGMGFPATDGRRSWAAGDTAGPQNWCGDIDSGRGAGQAVDVITSFSRARCEGLSVLARRPIAAPGRGRREPRKRQMIRGALRRSLAMNGRRTRRGPTLHRNIIWRDGGAKAVVQSEPSRPTSRWSPDPPATLEMDGDDGRKKPAPICTRCRPLHITAI